MQQREKKTTVFEHNPERNARKKKNRLHHTNIYEHIKAVTVKNKLIHTHTKYQIVVIGIAKWQKFVHRKYNEDNKKKATKQLANNNKMKEKNNKLMWHFIAINTNRQTYAYLG